MKTACITGISGQTGSVLAEMLLKQNYQVYGLKRRSSSHNTERIDHIFDHPNLKLVYGDLSDSSSIVNFISDIKPDEFYNLGAMSFVKASFEIPEYTYDVDGIGVLRCLEAIRKFSPKTRFLQASTSELYGSSPPPQNENTKMHPRSPYAVGKLLGYWTAINYREAYNLFSCNAISFNHEGVKRGECFLSRKITRGATRIKLGLQDKLILGNLSAKRDFSDFRDVAAAQILIMNADVPEEYVVASGEMHSGQELVELVFDKLNLDWKKYVEIDPKYFRPTEVDALCGDATKIRTKLGWEPKYSFKMLIDEMVAHDLELARKEKILKGI